MAAPRPRTVVFGPEKGSFPLDHFKECDEHYKAYMTCLSESGNHATKCRHISKEYLECRMKNDLMKPEKLSKLGFHDDYDDGGNVKNS